MPHVSDGLVAVSKRIPDRKEHGHFTRFNVLSFERNFRSAARLAVAGQLMLMLATDLAVPLLSFPTSNHGHEKYACIYEAQTITELLSQETRRISKVYYMDSCERTGRNDEASETEAACALVTHTHTTTHVHPVD